MRRCKFIEELELTEKLLEDQRRVINEIPPCPVHGEGCVPHAIEWVKKAKEAIRPDESGDEFYVEFLDGMAIRVEAKNCSCASVIAQGHRLKAGGCTHTELSVKQVVKIK